jgi:hypothetical protein
MFFNTSTSTIEKGREALKWFHNTAATYSGYNLTFEQLLVMVAGGPQKVQNFLDGFGFAIQSVENNGFLWSSKTQDAMENLARAGAGRIPANPNAFFTALSNSAQDVSWVQVGAYTAKETAKVALDTAVSIGETVSTTFQGLQFLFPLLVIGSVVFIVVQRTKQAAG